MFFLCKSCWTWVINVTDSGATRDSWQWLGKESWLELDLSTDCLQCLCACLLTLFLPLLLHCAGRPSGLIWKLSSRLIFLKMIQVKNFLRVELWLQALSLVTWLEWQGRWLETRLVKCDSSLSLACSLNWLTGQASGVGFVGQLLRALQCGRGFCGTTSIYWLGGRGSWRKWQKEQRFQPRE